MACRQHVAPISASVITEAFSLCMSLFSPKDTSHFGLRVHPTPVRSHGNLPNSICNDLISKYIHFPRCLQESTSAYLLGDTIQPMTGGIKGWRRLRFSMEGVVARPLERRWWESSLQGQTLLRGLKAGVAASWVHNP